ncbi:mediator of RNA polymerase II transcription subunit 27 [Aplysia californica]|uniref:Mediator of RNA polymerase II transcription subunit 27 n=1 Tax=Aplysia californica TaxID=6500 RepID=A0ABM0JF94_APLCA|nr:mediator of RNA polymerase II transcription subunit 27 [Aplysia californica]
MNHEPVQTPTELIQASIHLIQKLRTGVGQVFKDLSDGISEHADENSSKEETDSTAASSSTKDAAKDKNSTISSQNQKEGSGTEKSEDQQEKHRAILRTLKRSLETISHDFSDLEKTGGHLGPVHMLSNIDYLSLDPVDKNTVMHPQLLQAYKWTNKMHELANQAFTVLSQNSLKRTQSPFFTSAKKQKGSLPVACLVPPVAVDTFVHNLDQSNVDMSISISRPLGSCGVMQIDLKRTLRAVVVLRGLMIEWVKVKGFDETFKTEDGQIDIWSSSRYQVFQKITDHAEAASLHYYAPAKPEIAIKSFVLWLEGFSTLFSAPCHKCGKHLQNNMPPTWRDFRSREPFHDVCRM